MGTPTGSISLTGSEANAVLRPDLGGRVQSLRDVRSGRELLFQRTGRASADFVTASTGGWDELFPNDAPFGGHPDHGRIWSSPFAPVAVDATSATLVTRLPDPHATVTRRYTLLAAPRAGLRVETRLEAHEDIGTSLWSSHPMLAVQPGWRVETSVDAWRVDDELPGRFAAGSRVNAAAMRSVTGRNQGFVEVLYGERVEELRVASADGRTGTRLRWDRDWFGQLWLVTVSGVADLDLCLVPEPSTASSWRLDEVARGAFLAAHATRSWWVELESADAR